MSGDSNLITYKCSLINCVIFLIVCADSLNMQSIHLSTFKSYGSLYIFSPKPKIEISLELIKCFHIIDLNISPNHLGILYLNLLRDKLHIETRSHSHTSAQYDPENNRMKTESSYCQLCHHAYEKSHAWTTLYKVFLPKMQY